MLNFIFGVPMLKVILWILIISLSSAKYLPKNTQNREIYFPKQTQNQRFPQSNIILSTSIYDRQAIEKRREIRNRMTPSSGNSPAENMRTGLSIRIGNHQIQQTANGLHVQLGFNSNRRKLQSQSNKIRAQFRFRNIDSHQNGAQRKSSFNQAKSSGLTRIILMRNRNNGPRRNLIVKTSRGTQIHISRNGGKGKGMNYIINTGNRASTMPNLDNQLRVSKNNQGLQNSDQIMRSLNDQLPVSKNNQGLQNSGKIMRSLNDQLPVSKNNQGLQNSGQIMRSLNDQLPVSINNQGLQNSGPIRRSMNNQLPVSNDSYNKWGFLNSAINALFDTPNSRSMDNQLPVSNALYNQHGFQNSGFGPDFETTTRQALSTTEPEDVELFP